MHHVHACGTYQAPDIFTECHPFPSPLKSEEPIRVTKRVQHFFSSTNSGSIVNAHKIKQQWYHTCNINSSVLGTFTSIIATTAVITTTTVAAHQRKRFLDPASRTKRRLLPQEAHTKNDCITCNDGAQHRLLRRERPGQSSPNAFLNGRTVSYYCRPVLGTYNSNSK